MDKYLIIKKKTGKGSGHNEHHEKVNKRKTLAVILNLELEQFWLFLAAFGTPLMQSFPINKKHKTFIYIHVSTVNIYDIISFE
jgi:hypothetical protein